MFEQFNQVRHLLEQARPALKNYVADTELADLEQEIAQRTQDQQPVVMVYGVYNAGKSTLINALVGAEVAEVGDIPKTDRVDAYSFGDVTILDTPGIDAPIEHENITREQLAKSDAVVFVLCSDGVMEEQQTYEEIAKILRAGKPMLVVINNKSGYEPQSADYIALVERFRHNLKQYFADDSQIQEQLLQMEDFLVNARTALKGKLEDKPVLVERSQLNVLEQAIARLFAKTNSAQIAKTLVVQLQSLLQKAMQQAEQGKQSHELMQLQELLSQSQAGQQRVKERTLAFAANGKAAMKSELIELLHNGQSEQAQAALAQWQQQLMGQFETQLQRELQLLDVEAEQVAQLFIQQTDDLQVEQVSGDNSPSGFTHLFKALTQSGLRLNVTEELAKEGIVAALKQGKNWLPAVFKGVGPVTMGKWATKTAPLIGPAIDMVMAVYDYYKANEVEQRQVRQEQQRHEKINLKVNGLVDNIYEQLSQALEDTLQDVFAPLIKQLQQTLAGLSQQTDGVEADLAELKRLEIHCAGFKVAD